METDTKTKVWKACSIEFSITIQKDQTSETLIAEGRYSEISENAQNIIRSLVPEMAKEDKIMDIELIEFEKKPNEDDVQEEFKKRGLLFPDDLDALRFGAKYHQMGNLLNKQLRCCVIFPHEKTANSSSKNSMFAICYYGDKKSLGEGEFGTKWFERWFFAGLRPRQ